MEIHNPEIHLRIESIPLRRKKLQNKIMQIKRERRCDSFLVV